MEFNTLRVSLTVGALALSAAVLLSGCNKPGQPPATPGAPAVATPATPVSSTDAADAKAFLEGLYAHYKVEPSQGGWDSTDDKTMLQIYDSGIIAAWKQERAIPTDGPSDVDDGDMLCQCQDYTPFTTTITVSAATATTAKAAADFKVDTAARHVDFDLVKTAAGWRIHDLRGVNPGDPDQMWLSAAIAKAIKDQTANAAAAKKGHADEAP